MNLEELMRSGLQTFCWFRGRLHIRLDGRSLPIAVHSICVGLQGKQAYMPEGLAVEAPWVGPLPKTDPPPNQ